MTGRMHLISETRLQTLSEVSITNLGTCTFCGNTALPMDTSGAT